MKITNVIQITITENNEYPRNDESIIVDDYTAITFGNETASSVIYVPLNACIYFINKTTVEVEI